MSLAVFASLAIFIGMLFILYRQQSKQGPLSRSVMWGLILGSTFGFALQLAFSQQSQIISLTLEWVDIVGQGYVNLLKMIIMPLVLVSMIAAVVKLEKGGSLGKISTVTISILLLTTAIAALIGIAVTTTLGLSAEGLTEGARETARLADLQSRASTVSDLSIPQMLLSFMPSNPFADLTGARSTSIIAVVIFGVLVGIAARKVMLEKQELEAPIRSFVEAIQAVVMRLVKMIMALTPYGIAALMTKVVASSSPADIIKLLGFIVASYMAIGAMFLVHALLVSLVGISRELTLAAFGQYLPLRSHHEAQQQLFH